MSLDQVLRHWRATKNSRLSSLAVRLSEARDPLDASKKGTARDAWWGLEAKQDPADFPRLAVASRGGNQAEVIARITALARWNDARFATAMMTFLEDPPYAGVRSRGMLTRILELALETEDRRVIPIARDLAIRFPQIVRSSTGGWMAEQLEQFAEALEQVREPPLTPEGEALCEALGSTAEPRDLAPPVDLDALLAIVRTHPDDDGPRWVLADALAERGDPYGAFIARQLSGEAVHPAQYEVWGHPLTKAGTCVFERGFVSKVDCYRALPARIIGHAAWGTVTTLHGLEKISQKRGRAILESAPAVRNVGNFRGAQFAKLMDRSWPFEGVGLFEATQLQPTLLGQLPDLVRLSIERCDPDAGFLTGAPQLRSLALRDMSMADLAIGRTLPNLDTLHLTFPRERVRLDGLDLVELQLVTDRAPQLGPQPRLERLELDWIVGRLKSLVTPALRELTIRARDQSLPPLPSLLEVMIAPACRVDAEGLRHLRHLDARVPLGAVPESKTLQSCVLCGPITPHDLSALIGRCPNLTELTVRTPTLPDDPSELIARAEPLRSFTVEFDMPRIRVARRGSTEVWVAGPGLLPTIPWGSFPGLSRVHLCGGDQQDRTKLSETLGVPVEPARFGPMD